MKPTLQAIEARIAAALPDARISLTDDSHLHVGHTGAEGGAGHYSAVVIDARFAGLSRIARHRLVYDALADWMPERIHALALRALTQDEATAAGL